MYNGNEKTCEITEKKVINYIKRKCAMAMKKHVKLPKKRYKK